MIGPAAARSADGSRLHLQHGPIDLIIESDGPRTAVDAAYAAAWHRFQTVLDELVTELPMLRSRVGSAGPLSGSVARRMENAAAAFDAEFVTPMAAVAGAVADEICDVIGRAGSEAGGISRAFVNNGGDIALSLTPGTSYEVGLVPVPNRPALAGKATILETDPVRGVATSGRHGRSRSLGIADAATVLAHRAAVADVAATLLANSVDIPKHPAVERIPASELDPDSDLGSRLVTVAVGPLTADEVTTALAAGKARAEAMVGAGTITAAVLCLEDQLVTVGSPAGSAIASGGDEARPEEND